MRIKPKTAGQKVADTMTTQVGKLESDDLILQLQKYLDEGRGSSLEQILMGRAIAELVKLREEMANLTNPATCFKMGVMEEAHISGRISGSETLALEIADLSIENVMKICREDEQNQLAEMLGLQEEANFNNEQFNKGNMK